MANTKRYGGRRAHTKAAQARSRGYKAAGTRTRQGGSRKRMEPVNPTAGATPIRSNATRGVGGAIRQAGMNIRRNRNRQAAAMGDAGLRRKPRKR